MKFVKNAVFILFVISLVVTACHNDSTEVRKRSTVTIKGLYSCGPEIKSFTDCEGGREYWVADSAKTLELAYNKLNFEKPYEPVYIEVECHLVKSDSLRISADFDSTMIVTKVLKITKEIPDGPCNQ